MADIDFYYPFDSIDGDRKTTAATERRFFDALFADGVVGAGGFPITYVSEGVYSIGEGVAIIGGAIGGVLNAKQVTARPAAGVTAYIVLRLDTTSAVRKITLEVVTSVLTATAEQLDNGGVHDLILYSVTGQTGGGFGLLDRRTYATSFDNTIYSQDFQKLYDEAKAANDEQLDALRVNAAQVVAAANAEIAGLYGAAARQGFMNPNFAVNQRGSSFYGVGSGSYFTYDRWKAQVIGANGISTTYFQREQQGDRLALSIQFAGFAGTAAAVACISQNIENGVRAFCSGGKSFTVSFDAKASTAARLAVEPTQYAVSGGAGTIIDAQVVNLTTEWKRFSVTFAGTLTPEVASQLTDVLKVAFYFGWRGNTARFGDDQNEAVTVYLANMQINEGSAALPCYVRPYAEELAACQRYYCAFGSVSLVAGNLLQTTKQAVTAPLPLPRRMYRTPDVTFEDRAGAVDVASAEVVAGGWRNGLTCVASSNSVDNPVFVVTNTDTAAFTRVEFSKVEVNAEIGD